MISQEFLIKSAAFDAREIKFCPARMLVFIPTQQGFNKVELSYTSSRILELLVSRPGSIVEREEILSYAWKGRIVTQNNLNQSIKCVREILGDDVAKEIIQTVPRRGYMFNPDYLVGDISTKIDDLELVAPLAAKSPDTGMRRSASASISFGAILVRIRWQELLLAFLIAVQLLVLSSHMGLFFSDAKTVYVLDQDGSRYIYIGSDEAEIEGLKEGFSSFLPLKLDATNEKIVVVFNKMHEFYQASCLSSVGKAVSLYIRHDDVNSAVAEEFLHACVKG